MRLRCQKVVGKGRVKRVIASSGKLLVLLVKTEVGTGGWIVRRKRTRGRRVALIYMMLLVAAGAGRVPVVRVVFHGVDGVEGPSSPSSELKMSNKVPARRRA